MKYLFLSLIVLLFISMGLQAQTLSQSFGNNPVFANVESPGNLHLTAQLTGGNAFQKTNLENNNDIALPSYAVNGQGSLNTYFSDDWVKGWVTTTDNQTYSNGLVFMFDKVGHQLFYKKADSIAIMEADMSKISVFSLITDKQHIFIRGNFLSKDHTGEIFEVLVLDNKKFSFFKSDVCAYQAPTGSSAAKALMQTTNTGKYVDNYTYYTFRDNSLQQAALNKKDFIKSLAPDELIAYSYIQTNKSKFNEKYAVELVNYVNSK